MTSGREFRRRRFERVENRRVRHNDSVEFQHADGQFPIQRRPGSPLFPDDAGIVIPGLCFGDQLADQFHISDGMGHGTDGGLYRETASHIRRDPLIAQSSRRWPDAINPVEGARHADGTCYVRSQAHWRAVHAYEGAFAAGTSPGHQSAVESALRSTE